MRGWTWLLHLKFEQVQGRRNDKKKGGGSARSPVATNRDKIGMNRASAQGVRNVQMVQGHASQQNFEIYRPLKCHFLYL